MEYVYAALILHETDEEINEENLTDVLEAAGVDVEAYRADVESAAAGAAEADEEEAEEADDEDEGDGGEGLGELFG